MNILESYADVNPYGATDECAKFSIDTIESPFELNSIMTDGLEYTFSFWLKSTADGGVSVYDTVFPSSTEWVKYVLTFTATGEKLSLYFNTVGEYYIYHPQLEIGNKATDWTAAPEDVDDAIIDMGDQLHDSMTEQYAELVSTAEGITASALESYVKLTDYGDFKETVESQLEVLPGEIEIAFTTTTEQINAIDSDVQTKFAELNTFITLNEDGITLSAGENTMTLKIQNDKISFQKNGQEFGWWDGVDFHTGNIVVDVNERAQFGNFAYIPRSDGSLMFLKVSG